MPEQPPPQSSKNERIATLITPEPVTTRQRRAFPLDSAPAARRRSPLIGVLLGLAIAIIAAALYWLMRG